MKVFCFILGFLVFTSTAYPKKAEIKSTQNNDKVSSKQEEKSKLATSIDFSEQTNLELLKRASNKNNPDAQYELASRYFKGKGLPVNHEKALNLLEKSAEQNNYKAQLLLANFYNTGLCSLNVDTNKAIYYYELASKHENKAYPIYSMATIYEQGDKNKREIALDLYIQAANLGCKNSLYRIENIAKNSIKAQFHLALLDKNIDTNKAVDKFIPFLENTKYKDQASKELREIADVGNPKAQYIIGVAYEEGSFLKASIDKAIHYYELSAKQDYYDAYAKIRKLAKDGYPQAQYTIGYLYHKGIILAKDLDYAIHWYKKAVQNNNKDATLALIEANNERNADLYFYLGNAYREGIGVEKDEKKAFNYYKKSTEWGYNSAISNLGMCYEMGVGVKQNYKKALKYYLLAAEKGNKVALVNIARAYTHARGVEQNYVEALKWLKKGAKENNIDAIVDLGIAYEKGYGTEVDMDEALGLFMLAANRNNTFALFKIASFYECGEGLEKDKQKALELYKKAAILGNKEAMDVLNEYREAGENGDKEAELLFNNLKL